MRRAARPVPRTAPCARNASIAKSLQLGQNRQLAPITGRIVH
jgi:hypothetical protein